MAIVISIRFACCDALPTLNLRVGRAFLRGIRCGACGRHLVDEINMREEDGSEVTSNLGILEVLTGELDAGGR